LQLEELKSFIINPDVSNGVETIPVPLINAVDPEDDRELPFKYISKRISGEGVRLPG